MASSSSRKTHHDCKIPCPFEEEEDDDEKERDWLELGLGFGCSGTTCRKQELHNQSYQVLASASSPSSPSSPQLQQQQKMGKGLGLGLGLSHDNESVMPLLPPTSNYNHSCSWWQQRDEEDQQDHYYHHCDDIPSWPWHMDSGSCLGLLHDWQMPLPNDSHDYTRATRPHSGLWFTLRSSTNREGEVLPQIPKAYIRVKDENVTVFMVKKYLVRKLGLSNEAEIDIWCMGQNLLHTQTLKQVRDSVWLPRLVGSVDSTMASYENSLDSSLNHLMSLHYGRRHVMN